MKLSIVVPFYNEEVVAPFMCERLQLMKKCGGVPIEEFILVDDGSKDKTLEVLKAAAKSDSRVKIISFSRNFGHQIAVTAGLDASTGDAAVVLDGDMQDPPEVIELLVRKWLEGYGVVYAIRRTRQDGFLKRAACAIFYRVLRKLTEINIPLDSGDFALIDKKVLSVLRSMPERSRFVRGLRAWIGFKSIGVEYERHARFAGDTKYPFKKLLNLALVGMFGFSTIPLRFATYSGLFVAFISFVFGVWIFIARLVFHSTFFPVGWSSLMVSLFFMGGIQLFIVGILGEYIGMIYRETQARPLYIVQESIGFENEIKARHGAGESRWTQLSTRH